MSSRKPNRGYYNKATITSIQSRHWEHLQNILWYRQSALFCRADSNLLSLHVFLSFCLQCGNSITLSWTVCNQFSCLSCVYLCSLAAELFWMVCNQFSCFRISFCSLAAVLSRTVCNWFSHCSCVSVCSLAAVLSWTLCNSCSLVADYYLEQSSLLSRVNSVRHPLSNSKSRNFLFC